MDGSPRARDRHEGLTKLSSREAIAALKQSAFPPSTGCRPHAYIGVLPHDVRADNTEAVSLSL